MKLYLKEKINGKDYIDVRFSSLFWAYILIGIVSTVGFCGILFLLNFL